MPFVHNQTFVPQSIPVKTNWSVDTINNASLSTGYSYQVPPGPLINIVPKVESYLGRFEGQSAVNAPVVTYQNPIPIEWSTYTIEFWLIVADPFVTNTVNPLYVGSVTGDPLATIRFNANRAFDVTAGKFIVNMRIYFNLSSPTFVGGYSPDTLIGPAQQPAWANYCVVQERPGLRKFYINGKLVTTDTGGPNYIPNTTTGPFAVSLGNINSPGAYAMDQLRISNVARYTSNYTPQTTPFANDDFTYMLVGFENTWQPAPSPT
jgi:hypothetical protein